MSQCEDFEEAWWEAAEGRPLPAAAEAHLRTCESCRATVRRLSAASRGFEALRAVEAPDPSAVVWQRLTRPKRRPAFALAWAAGAVACVVAATFALWHPSASHPVTPVPPPRQVARAPRVPPVAPSVNPTSPVHTSNPAPSVKPSATGRVSHAGSGGRLVSTHRDRLRTKRHGEPRPETPPQTQLVEAPPASETMVVEAAADAPCSEAAALAYRAIGRALVARFLPSNAETG